MYWLRYWKRNLSASVHDWGRGEVLAALLLYVVAAIPIFFGVSSLNRPMILVVGAGIALSAIAWFLALLLLITPARTWANDQQTIGQLESRFVPRLSLVHERSSSPFEQTTDLVDEERRPCRERRFRVGIQNLSDVTIDDVSVSVGMEGMAFGPVPLRLMHDNPPDGESFQRSFHLNPREVRYADVVWRLERDHGPGGEIVLCYAVPRIPNCIPASRHELTIRAHGRNTPPCERVFVVDVDDHDCLTLGAATGAED